MDIKNRTRKKVVNMANPKSSSPRPLRAFPSPLLVSEKVIRSANEVCLPYVEQSINRVFILKMAAYYKQEWTK